MKNYDFEFKMQNLDIELKRNHVTNYYNIQDLKWPHGEKSIYLSYLDYYNSSNRIISVLQVLIAFTLQRNNQFIKNEILDLQLCL